MEDIENKKHDKQYRNEKEQKCRHHPCTRMFKTHSNRCRHEKYNCKFPSPVKRKPTVYNQPIYVEEKSCYRCFRCPAQFP